MAPPAALPSAPPVPFVWLLEGGMAPSDEARRALETWARARGIELAPPRSGEESGARATRTGMGTGTATDRSAAEEVERGLARVRDALAGLDFDAAERALARAEGALRDHPELPQAAWLRAEVERAWSARWLREGDEPRAKRAWQRAAGLDRGREPGLGEKAFEPAGAITATIRVVGRSAEPAAAEIARGIRLRLDGEPIAPGEVRRTEGEHALAIVGADGRAIWAEWVSLAQGGEVRIAAPEPAPCSLEDVGRARLGKDGATVGAAGVVCPAWVAAVPGLPGSAEVVRVATCERETCGALVEWRSIETVASGGWTFEPVAPAAESRFKWPAWGTWTLVGVGVAGAAVGIAAAAGAFKSSQAPETQFVNGGITVHSF